MVGIGIPDWGQKRSNVVEHSDMAPSRPGRQLPVNPYAQRPLEQWRTDLMGHGATEDRYRAFVAVTELQAPTAALVDILPVLSDPDGDLRAASANWCARMLAAQRLSTTTPHDSDLETALEALRQDPDPDVVLAALRALSWLKPPPGGLAVQILQLLTRDDIQSTSLAILAELLGRVPDVDEAGVSQLRTLLAHEQAEVREAASGALASLGSLAGSAAPELIVALDDEEPLVREQAALALGRLNRITDEARESLMAAGQDADPGVAAAATQALLNHQAKP